MASCLWVTALEESHIRSACFVFGKRDIFERFLLSPCPWNTRQWTSWLWRLVKCVGNKSAFCFFRNL